MNESNPPDLVIRPPAPAEVPRAIYLFGNQPPRPQARMLAAVRRQPVERFVAAAAWWPEGNAGCFQLASLAGTFRKDACVRLIEQTGEQARLAGMKTLQYGDLLASDSEWMTLLLGLGFKSLRSERFFEMAVEQSWARTMAAYEKHKTRIPPDWKTESIRRHGPETVMDLIAGYRLMPPAEVAACWRADLTLGFDPDMSSILFERDRPIGVLLARRKQDSLYVDIRVVAVKNQLLRALGNVLLFRHMAVQRQTNADIRLLKFRGGAAEHRETANLAMRMQGRELPPRHVLAKSL